MLTVPFPLGALNAPCEPGQEPTLTVYSHDLAQNARHAIRLGNANFQRRVNTDQMTATDIQIATLIQTRFAPFFEKLNQLDNAPEQQKQALQAQYSDEFNVLVLQFGQLLFKNQNRFTNPLLLDDKVLLEEALNIVQEAIDKGHF